MATDEQLIERTLSGDQEAFGSLVTKYQDRLNRMALAILRDPEEAKDVVQETFLQAYVNLAGFRRSSRFYTWLYRISYNVAVGVLRQKKRVVPADRMSDESWGNLAGRGESPEDRQCRAESVEILRTALDRLAVEYRTPMVLREIEGASYEEIAEIIGIPIGTVRSRLFRARTILREIISRYEKDLS